MSGVVHDLEVKVNKADVIDRVAGASGVAKQQAEGVLDAFFDTVKSAVRGGDRVGWPSFGSFSATQRKARTGRNPRTGEAVKISASTAMKFTPGSALKDFLNPKPPAKKTAAAKGGGAAAPKKPTATKASAAKASASKASGKKTASATKAPAKKSAKTAKR
jgi:DNA-binding protein HU-beta